MKTKIQVTIILLFLCQITFAQEKKKVHFRDVAISLGVPYIDENLGLQLGLSSSLAIDRNLVKAYVAAGGEFNVSFGSSSEGDSFQEYDLLYGREIPLSEKVRLELYGGVGYFIADKNLEEESVIGFPVQFELLFPTERKINYGIQAHANINSFMPIGSLAFLVKYQF